MGIRHFRSPLNTIKYQMHIIWAFYALESDIPPSDPQRVLSVYMVYDALICTMESKCRKVVYGNQTLSLTTWKLKSKSHRSSVRFTHSRV